MFHPVGNDNVDETDWSLVEHGDVTTSGIARRWSKDWSDARGFFSERQVAAGDIGIHQEQNIATRRERPGFFALLFEHVATTRIIKASYRVYIIKKVPGGLFNYGPFWINLMSQWHGTVLKTIILLIVLKRILQWNWPL